MSDAAQLDFQAPDFYSIKNPDWSEICHLPNWKCFFISRFQSPLFCIDMRDRRI